MKNKNSAASYCNGSIENPYIFSAIFSVSSFLKKDYTSQLEEFKSLFHEKLPIIYANIRV